MKEVEYNCRVCGFDNYPDYFWKNDIPDYVICPRCSCESGNEDYSIEAVKRYREKWINGGADWVVPKENRTDGIRKENLKKTQ
ncbi:hypothetical protein [Bergeyella zoohelcum]|uniref:Rubredoxin-like domain-containing protein n=1 Tax=Bergeyella zoohelcum TaxID=1015 RepID=A0A380ZS10_9FLAO|nr:hypothetical protein [Bergeyella zoohelcum]EKB60658.1 hypothetical protein HMPREF9700_00153 [Bergeyella zoohelcum CCUG 30536]SUV52137.1 Uncharacterised protein [Bergeyella zoohelcum]